MSILNIVIFAVLAISLVTFVALFGRIPAFRRTPIGWLHRLLCVQIPKSLRRADESITGGRVSQKSQILGHYLFYKRNPIVLIIFLFLLTGSSVLFLWNITPLLPTKLILPIPFLLASPYIFTYLAVTSKASLVTRSNHGDRVRDYPFDHLLFRPGNVCSTCDLIKPARSKHCSLCGCCVARCDHHCPWINNCVGRDNYRYFLGLLLSLCTVQVYGAYLSWWILSPYLKFGRPQPFFSHALLNELSQGLAIAIEVGGISIAGVGMLAALTAMLPLGLLAFHCYLIWAGMTTNESQKWTDWKHDVRDGYVFSAARQSLLSNLRPYDGSDSATDLPLHPVIRCLKDSESARVPWPIPNDRVIVSTYDVDLPQGQGISWVPVRTIREIDNIYDLGGWRNLMEVLRGR